MATIKDVALKAGVSKTLVSRYINHKSGVSVNSKEKIKLAIQELNFRPNGIARSLVLHKTHTIGVIVDSLHYPFVSQLIAGFEKATSELDEANQYNVIYSSSNGNAQKKQQQVEFLTQGRVDGLIIYGSLVTDDVLVYSLARANFPLTLIENDVADVTVNKVIIDNVEGAYRATEHLIKLGFRKILHIAGTFELKITEDRLKGYQKALEHYQIPIDKNLIVCPDFSDFQNEERTIWNEKIFYDIGYQKVKALLQKGVQFDSAFLSSDVLGFGAIKAINEAGLRVPEEISIIGFDNEKPSDFDAGCEPISTMEQPIFQAGYLGMKLLIESIQSDNVLKKRVELKTKLLLRKSCKPLSQ